MATSMIKIKGLNKTYHTDQGDVHAVRDLEFEVEKGSFFTLLGPSGSGKTTTLRCIAGLESPDSGEIHIDGQLVAFPERGISVPPHKRNIGMVFQSYAIWPHMDVFGNVAFPLKACKEKISRKEIREKVRKALVLVRLEGLEKRPAPQLSGGQQQRLALARALVNEPQLLLLDEPLSNLDAKLREEMRIEIKEVVKKFNITTFYVTHDQIEALAMSDTLSIMNNGRLIQTDSPAVIYRKPKNKFVASFIGTSNQFEGSVEDRPDGRGSVNIRTTLGTIRCRLSEGVNMSELSTVIVHVRPEDIRLFHERPPDQENVFEGKIATKLFLGDSLDCRVLVSDTLVRLKLDNTAQVSEEDRVFIQLSPESCLAINQE